MRVAVSRWGNSLAVRLPRSAVAKLGISEGSRLELELDETGVRLSRPRPAIPPLSELLQEARRLRPPPFEDWPLWPCEWPDE